MSELEMPGAQVATNPKVPSRLGKIGWIVSVIGVALVVLILPRIYGYVVQTLSHSTVTPRIALHIVANCCSNAVVMLAAWGFRGRMHEKITSVLNTVLLTHGLLAVVIVATHSVYSNWVLLISALISTALGVGMTLLTRERDGPTVAIVTVPGLVPPAIGLKRSERVTDPHTDLRRFDLILIPSAGAFPSEWAASLSRAMLAGKPVRHVAEYLEEYQGQVSVEHFDIDDLPRGGLTSYRTGKRVLDFLVVIAVLPIVLPILLIAAIAVRLSMGPGVLFYQDRVGLGGAPFRMVKLRTMLPTSQATAVVTSQADARVTPLGGWLRRMRIDELPQLWHILTGEMSLIGPRPEWTLLADDYERLVPAYAFRQIVRPGLTGWAQVNSGYAGNVEEMRTKLGFDLYYLKNFSFALDLQILVRTAGVILSGFGAR